MSPIYLGMFLLIAPTITLVFAESVNSIYLKLIESSVHHIQFWRGKFKASGSEHTQFHLDLLENVFSALVNDAGKVVFRRNFNRIYFLYVFTYYWPKVLVVHIKFSAYLVHQLWLTFWLRAYGFRNLDPDLWERTPFFHLWMCKRFLFQQWPFTKNL